MNTECKWCQQPILEEEGVAFGDLLFHNQCSKCAKCKQTVVKKTNLLSRDNRPVCDVCAYNCTLCQQIIQDEAIMTGDKAYHSACFQCITCKNPIQDLVFTQTTKGIYCSPCYATKRQEKQQQQKLSSLFSDYALDFFNHESSELANLSNSLGLSLQLTPITTTTQSRLNRASELLKSSLLPPKSSLEQDLLDSQTRLKELESSYKALQNASQQALDEFSQLQHELTQETYRQQQKDLVIVSLLQKHNNVLSRQEIDRIAMLRLELERTCLELIQYRDDLMARWHEPVYQRSLSTQTRSMLQERDLLETQLRQLRVERDGLIHQLADHQASPPISPSTSTENLTPRRFRKASDASSILSRVSSRASFIATDSPALFRLKKKGSTMFHKLTAFRSKQETTPSTTGHVHSFQPVSFIRPVPCGQCEEKIWGRSDYQCETCGFCCHSRCVEPTSLWTESLIRRAQHENRTVPWIVEACIEAVEKRGLDYEGIYRKSGGAAQIKAVQQAFESRQNHIVDLTDEEEYNDVGAITSTLKQYFRDLPDPLLTFALYDDLIEIASMHQDTAKLEAMKDRLSQLPKEHFDTLVMLFRHLLRVYQEVDKNRMSIKNLAMVFAPTLMRHPDPSRDFLDISHKNATIEYILLHLSQLV